MAPTDTSRVQREIKQRRPFRSPAQEAVVGLFRTVDRLRRVYTARLADAAVTPQQYNVLRILRGAGEEGLPTLEIAERMVEEAPGITRLIDRLERKRLVRRERCRTDRRQVTCRISAGGLALLERVDPVVEATDDLIGAALAPAQVRQLIGMLDRVRETLSR